MIPAQYYIAPKEALAVLNSVHHEFVTIGTARTFVLGWIDFETGIDGTLRKKFESQANVISLGTAIHPLHQKLVPAEPITGQDKEIQTSVKNAGVTASDNNMSALDKLQKYHGGFRVRL